MTRFEELHKLKEEMEKDDTLPLKKGATKLVFGTGNTEAKILCIGEGPGYNEDKIGELKVQYRYIEEYLNSDAPPPPAMKPMCKKCAYYEYCFI